MPKDYQVNIKLKVDSFVNPVKLTAKMLGDIDEMKNKIICPWCSHEEEYSDGAGGPGVDKEGYECSKCGMLFDIDVKITAHYITTKNPCAKEHDFQVPKEFEGVENPLFFEELNFCAWQCIRCTNRRVLSERINLGAEKPYIIPLVNNKEDCEV